jgi:polygalacturonase
LRRYPGAGGGTVFDIRGFGAVGDGKTIDSPAINRAIEAASANGGTVYVPPGTYLCYSLRLKNAVALYLDQAATILAAGTPREGTASGYDPAESNAPWEDFQDFGHNHWHNSLIWGEHIHDVAVLGPGLICGRGLAAGMTIPIFRLPKHQASATKRLRSRTVTTSSCAISRCSLAGTSRFSRQGSTI